MKILVAGGRKFGEYSYNEEKDGKWIEVVRDRQLAIDERKLVNIVLNFYRPTYIIQGNAKGADRMAQLWANKNNVSHSGSEFSAEWEKYGPRAGGIRNKRMLNENPDIELVIAFSGGSGTDNMVTQSRKADINVIEPVIKYTD